VKFYEVATRLHGFESAAIEFLINERSKGKEVVCVDNILNTWPG
jgi:hypothetical protein